MGALVTRGFIPPEVATTQNIDWYMEEETGNRCFVVKKGIENILSSTNGADFDLGISGPNLPIGHTVKVNVIHSSSKENTFRLEYVPYLANEDLVTFISSFFCDVIRANVDLKRKDVWWVTTTTPLEELPHWVVAENLVHNIQSSRLLVSVKDRDVQCFFCRETLHWTNQCRLKKSIEKEERQMFLQRKKLLREQQIQQAKERGNGEVTQRDRNQDNQNPRPSSQQRHGFPPRHNLHEDSRPVTTSHANPLHKSTYYPDLTPEGTKDNDKSANNSFSSVSSEHNSYLSPNSAQRSPSYSVHISPDTPPSAQPPRRSSRHTDRLKPPTPDLREVTWQQEAIDALSPKSRGKEIADKSNRDLANIRQRKEEAKDAEAKQREVSELKLQESHRKQLANEESQRRESIQKKEAKEKTRQLQIEDEKAMEMSRLATDDKPTVTHAKKQKKKRKAKAISKTRQTVKQAPAKALFNNEDTTDKVPTNQQDTVKKVTPRNEPQLTDGKSIECESKGPSLTSTPRPTRSHSAPLSNKEQSFTTPNTPAPFGYLPNTPDKRADDTQGTPVVLCNRTKLCQDQRSPVDKESSKNSLMAFYSSNPESGLSQIINALSSSPKPGDKRVNDHTNSHDDSKRPIPDNTSLIWEHESLNLQADQNPNPAQSANILNVQQVPTAKDDDDKHS